MVVRKDSGILDFQDIKLPEPRKRTRKAAPVVDSVGFTIISTQGVTPETKSPANVPKESTGVCGTILISHGLVPHG